MNRVKAILLCLSTLPLLSLLIASPRPAVAQRRTGQVVQRPPKGKPFVGNLPLPAEVTRKALRGATGRADITTPQTIDLTPNTNTPGKVVTNRNPYWSKDEQYILFDSDRANLSGTDVAADKKFHLYRMRPSGDGVTAITGPLSNPAIGATTSQTEGAYNPATSTIVYIETEASGSVDLRELNLSTNVDRSILKNNPQGFVFTALNHPEYGFSAAGGIIFSGKRASDPAYKLFTVDSQSGTVSQLTFGISDDRNPTVSPPSVVVDPGPPAQTFNNVFVVAFDSNRANPDGTSVKANRDIWVMGTNPNIQAATRVTDFSASGRASDNIQPAWSTNNTDRPTGSQRFVRGQQLLAFASTRVDQANDGNANAVDSQGRHDIYWLKATLGKDPNNPSQFTVITPEDSNALAIKLSTSDPQHQYDDTHPTWPQFIETYRVAYQSNRKFYVAASNVSGPPTSGNPPATDIFASTLIDLNSPTLIRDPLTNEIVTVNPRTTASPGSPVTISVKLADFESGIRDVWVQVKNPNSKYQSSDGKEHKVFTVGGLALDGSNTALNVPVEYDAQRIFIGDDPSDGRVNSYADPLYIASIDDWFAYSGENELYAIDNATGVEKWRNAGWLHLSLASRDPLTGASTYSGTWKTDNFPSDYVVDVIAADNSLNPFTRNATDTGVNWKIYDNVGGFTTQPFQAAHNILFVSDNSAGQKFFGSRFGASTLINVTHSFWGTESWMTDIDVSLLPNSYVNGTTTGSLIDVRNTLGVHSYDDALARDGTVVDGRRLNPTQSYDMWRILCRGPLPDAVLQQYAPHMEAQPADIINGETTPRSVLVSPRCVIWNAPYTGNLFTQPGSITDLATQIQLQSFLAAGGRLVVSGQDIAWAMTLGGATQSQFVSTALKASYVTDSPNSTFFRVPADLIFLDSFSAAYAMTASGAYNPISNDPWATPGKFTGSTSHVYFGPPEPPSTIDYLSNEVEYLFSGSDPTQPREYASPGDLYPDVVQPVAPAITDFAYGGGAGTAVLHYEDTATHQRVVYMPMGAEGLFIDWYTPSGSTNTIRAKNRRMELFHNCVCWLRTGSVVGTVVDDEAGRPLANVLVRLSNRTNGTGKAITAYTGLTGSDGSFRINGVEPDTYEVSAIYPGRTISKRTTTTTHGGFRDQIAFRMTSAEPATVKGKVTRTDGTTPIPGATVTATDVITNAVFTATTDLNGNYVFDKLPALTKYTLTASAPGFGASVPASVTVDDPNDPSGNRLLQPATVYQPFDFQLKAIPGSVTGFVYVNNNGVKGSPIAGATVTATCGGATVTAVTDANGAYSFNAANNPPNGLDPGVCGLVATAPGFGPNAAVNVTVASGAATTAGDILLTALPPGSLSGLVTRTSDNSPLSGVTIEVRDANGVLVAMTTSGAVQTVNGYRFNYLLPSVPAASGYVVTASASGFTPVPSSATANVISGQETKTVNFQMEPLHTFSGALSMVSTPYDYAGLPQNAAEILSVSPTDPAFLMATWDLAHYVYFPTPPADKFRLGRGYFLGYKTNLPLSIQGTPANPNQPFNISLAAGWNMIGDPFPFEIDWTKIQIVDGGVVKTYDQAVSTAAIGAGLYTYQSGTYVLDFRLSPWRGYWVRAYKPVTLRIDPTSAKSGRAAAVATSSSRAVLRGAEGWTLNLRAAVGNTVRDEDNHLGVSNRAADAFDGYKSEKPPVFGQQYVYLTFDHNDWGDHSGGYGVDIRSASTATHKWEFSVQTNVANSTATITWPNSATVGRATTLVLTDLATGDVRNITNSSSYSWQTGDKPATRQFRIEATRNTVGGGLRISNLVARGGSRASAATNVSFSLNSAANVEVRVLGANGTAVRKLSSRATRAAGANDVTWDQRSDQGSAVPAGVYTVEVKAVSIDGKYSARQIATVVIIR